VTLVKYQFDAKASGDGRQLVAIMKHNEKQNKWIHIASNSVKTYPQFLLEKQRYISLSVGA
jgi:hypothetical protein